MRERERVIECGREAIAFRSAMGRFVMAWASKLCELHQRPPPSPIFLSTTSWDIPSTRFLPPSHYRLPLPVNAELLAAAVIHNYSLGESLIHAAIRKGSALLIGCFDADTLKFDVLVEMELPNFMLQLAAEGYWLADGPVIVAQVCEKFLIVQSLGFDTSGFSYTSFDLVDNDDGAWHAFVLNLEGIGDVKEVRTLYCGEMGVFEGANVLLSLQFSSKVDSQTAPFSRFREGCNFVNISPCSIDPESSKDLCSSNVTWKPVPLKNIVGVCNDRFPSDVSVDLISCIGFILRYPGATVPSLVQDDKRPECSYHDIVIGHWSGKIVKYRMGAVVAQANLNAAPVSLQFAVVAEGQGILVCALEGENGTVVAICAETLLLLKAWPKSQDVVVGDFQMVGCDQLLVLSTPSDSESQIDTFGPYLIPQQLTDIKTCYFTAQQFVPHELSVEARGDVHKTESLNAIAHCLKSRMEAGVLQMRSMEEQRDERAELVRSSFVLLQEMATRTASSAMDEDADFSPSDLVGKIVKASITQQGTCGRTWFLVVMVENVCQKPLVLQDLSLSLSTMGGPISGSSSLIKSLSTVDTQKHLVASGSLMDLPNPMVYPTLHVLISAKACKENATCKTSRLTTDIATDIAREVRGMYYPYKAWIGQIESRNVQMTGNLNPTAVPLDFREVAPNHTFMINGTSSNHCAEIVDLIRKALRMANRADRQRDAVHEIVAGPGDLWADASIMLKGETIKVILRAEDSKHLTALKSCLVMLLGNNTKLQIEAPYSEILEKTLCFLRIFKEEIKQRRAMLKSIAEAALYNTSKDVEDFMTPALVECEMQMRTDRQFCSLLSALRMGSV